MTARQYRLREMIGFAFPWLLIAVVAAIELSQEITDAHDVRVGSLLSPAPALAAAHRGPRTVLAVAAAALAVGLGVALVDTTDGPVYHLTVLGAVAGVGLAGVAASGARERRDVQLTEVQRVAEAAQLALVPPVPRQVGELHLEGRYVAAEVEARIGGDLYEVVASREHQRLIIGDVRGKGLPAIRTAAAVLGAFREAANNERSLPGVAMRCSEAVGRLERDGGYFTGVAEAAELFVTAAVVEVDGPVVRVVNLGHPRPLLLTGRSVHHLGEEENLPPLGLAHLLHDDFPVCSVRWQPGHRLLLYTDGIDEARDADRQFFPLLSTVHSLLPEPSETFPDLLLEAVNRHTGDQLEDDAALLVVEWRPEGDG